MDNKKSIVEKKIHEEKAFKIVHRLAIETIDSETLTTIVKYIEPYHYEEIVEERFLSKLCGYPICDSKLKKIPTQKYQISSKLNQVYDIGDRKRYCSANCYKSSKYLESQVSNVPVWMRNTVDFNKSLGSKPITLLSSESKSADSTVKKVYHDEYELRFSSSNKAKSTKSEFSQIHDQVISKQQLHSTHIEMELNNIEDSWRTKYQVKKSTGEPTRDPLQKNSIFKHINVSEKIQLDEGCATRCSVTETEDQHNKENKEIATSQIENTTNKKFIQSSIIHQRPNNLYHLGKIFKILQATKSEGSTSKDNQEDTLYLTENNEEVGKYLFIEYIINRVDELLTNHSKQYIRENQRIEKSSIHEERKRLEYLKKCDELVTEKNVWFNDIAGQEDGETKVSSLHTAKDLHLLKSLDDHGEAEMLAKFEIMGINPGLSNPEEPVAEVNLDDEYKSKPDKHVADVNLNDEYKSVMKPMPDFIQLQSEAKHQQLKIKEFFVGDPFSAKAKKNRETEQRQAEETEMFEKDASSFSSYGFRMKGEGNEEIVRVLPTVDSLSQMEIRRKIFYEKLIKYMGHFLKFSDFPNGDFQFINHSKNFVFSLGLDNKNILFNTNEWPIVALFILKILSFKKLSTENDTNLSGALTNLINTNKLIETILASFNLNTVKFEKICTYLIE